LERQLYSYILSLAISTTVAVKPEKGVQFKIPARPGGADSIEGETCINIVDDWSFPGWSLFGAISTLAEPLALAESASGGTARRTTAVVLGATTTPRAPCYSTHSLLTAAKMHTSTPLECQGHRIETNPYGFPSRLSIIDSLCTYDRAQRSKCYYSITRDSEVPLL